MHNRRLQLISPIRRNVVGRLCISPTIVFLILSNQKARVRALTLRRMRYKFEIDFKVLFLYGGLVYIFYRHNIVGEFVYCTNDISGGAI